MKNKNAKKKKEKKSCGKNAWEIFARCFEGKYLEKKNSYFCPALNCCVSSV